MMQNMSIDLKIGNISLSHKLTPVPSNNTADGSAEWMYDFFVYNIFNMMLSSTAQTPFLVFNPSFEINF